MPPERTIAIVGAGLSGTLIAVNLLRSQHLIQPRHWVTTRIVLIERSAQMARGKAYAKREHPYLLNVPAGRMSAHPSFPLDFLAFAQQRTPGATAHDFLPRALYGDYLETTLLDAEVSAPPHVHFERIRGEVCALDGNDSGYRLQLSDERTLDADDVVLALGNPPAAELPGTEDLAPEHYIADPWAQPLTFQRGETVLLVGNGLTMADMADAAATSTKGQVVIHSLSRHGLVPPSQTQFSHMGCKGDSASLLRAASFSALTLFQRARELAAETELRGGDWREAITFIRNIAPALWQRLPAREKRRLLRHVRPYWDVHRHRLPSQTLAKLTHLRHRHRFHVHAGRLLDFEPEGSTVKVTWRSRGGHKTRTLLVDRVVNCTGPDYNIRRSREPLIRSLLVQGLVVPDAHGLGLRTGEYGALIGASGRAASNLFYVGPMLRADHWEATAAQELRGHAERLAGHLSTQAGRLRAAG